MGLTQSNETSLEFYFPNQRVSSLYLHSDIRVLKQICRTFGAVYILLLRGVGQLNSSKGDDCMNVLLWYWSVLFSGLILYMTLMGHLR